MDPLLEEVSLLPPVDPLRDGVVLDVGFCKLCVSIILTSQNHLATNDRKHIFICKKPYDNHADSIATRFRFHD